MLGSLGMRAAASRGLFGASLGGLSYLFYKHTELQVGFAGCT